jgi:hypothetical protein
MYNKILQINNVTKTSKRLQHDVDFENKRIIQTGMQIELAFGAITRWCFKGQQEMQRQHFEWVWNFRPPSDLFWLTCVCDGEHFVMFLKYTSFCCCSTWKIFIGLANLNYSLSACHLSMLHHHGLTALCLSKNRHWMMTHTMYRYCTKEDDGLTEGAYCSCTAGYEIYACFF